MIDDPGSHGAAGFLVDWDHCVMLELVDQVQCPTRVPCAVSQFLGLGLSFPNSNSKVAFARRGPGHSAVNDRESALHVLAWMTLVYLGHDMDAEVRWNLEMYEPCGNVKKRHAALLGGFYGVERDLVWRLIWRLSGVCGPCRDRGEVL